MAVSVLPGASPMQPAAVAKYVRRAAALPAHRALSAQPVRCARAAPAVHAHRTRNAAVWFLAMFATAAFVQLDVRPTPGAAEVLPASPDTALPAQTTLNVQLDKHACLAGADRALKALSVAPAKPAVRAHALRLAPPTRAVLPASHVSLGCAFPAPTPLSAPRDKSAALEPAGPVRSTRNAAPSRLVTCATAVSAVLDVPQTPVAAVAKFVSLGNALPAR